MLAQYIVERQHDVDGKAVLEVCGVRVLYNYYTVNVYSYRLVQVLVCLD